MIKQKFFENVVIITGASSGIGEQLAVNLAGQGAWLALVDPKLVDHIMINKSEQ